MRRSYRVVFSVAATAALAGGVGAAVGVVPASHPDLTASVLPRRSTDDPAHKAELAEAALLKARLARTTGDGEHLRAQIAKLEAATVRAQGVRAQKIRARSIQAMELRQAALELSRQRVVQAAAQQSAGQQANVGQASYVPPRSAPRLAASYAPVRRSAAPVRATRSSAPATHARTGASGAPTSTSTEKGDSEHDSGGSDD